MHCAPKDVCFNEKKCENSVLFLSATVLLLF